MYSKFIAWFTNYDTNTGHVCTSYLESPWEMHKISTNIPIGAILVRDIHIKKFERAKIFVLLIWVKPMPAYTKRVNAY